MHQTTSFIELMAPSVDVDTNNFKWIFIIPKGKEQIRINTWRNVC